MLDIKLLGEIAIKLDGKPVTGFRSEKEIALLAYLAHSGKVHSREALADLLWDSNSTEQSLSNLRTVLTRLQSQMGEHLIVTRKTVAISQAVHQKTDSVRFQTLLTSMGKQASAGATNQMVRGRRSCLGDGVH